MEEKVARVDESCKSAHKRIDRIEKLLEDNNKLVANVEIIANEMKTMREDFNKIDNRVLAIEEKPSKNWDKVVNIILTRYSNRYTGLFFREIWIVRREVIKMKEKFSKLIDLKSIITILLVFTLVILVITFAIKNGALEEKLFLLFSNIITMVITYFFTKKPNVEKTEENKGV